jgi:hypothetical protein
MSNGYVILAFNAQEQKAASACAYSIKIQNPHASVSMVINSLNNLLDKYEEPFDNIIELPFDTVEDIRANDWQLNYVTPYDNTIAIDCYSLVKEKHDELWEYLSNYEMCYSIRTMNFRTVMYDVVPDGYDTHNIKNLSSDLFYFKKDSEITKQFFLLSKIYMQQWTVALKEFIELQYIPIEYDSNLMHAFIISHLDIYQEVTPHHDTILEIIDMNSITKYLKDNDRIEKNWSDYINVWTSTDTKLKIQNYAINNTIVYKDKTFITDEIYDEHRKQYTIQTNLVG